jgi:hypothetical protein
VDSGASHDMIGPQKSLTKLSEKNSRLQVELRDNAKYAVKGVGTASFQLNSRNPLNMSEVLYVPGLKKNLLSISYMEERGYSMEFIDGKVLTWPKGSSIDST